jgi:hypothetical protein
VIKLTPPVTGEKVRLIGGVTGVLRQEENLVDSVRFSGIVGSGPCVPLSGVVGSRGIVS